MVNITINDIQYKLPAGLNIISACTTTGHTIPRFCYHDKLSIAGNCRLCLVQVKTSPKPVASCAMPIAEGMVISTNSEMVLKAREGALQLLLKNHPLDCPVCDQGGECDLQDQTFMFGSDRGRFYSPKRSVEDLNSHPIIKTNMTRCIHCTRCIRFAEEVAGLPVYGTTGRGEDTTVGSYIKQVFNSTLSGNIVDLCPVGALTLRPTSFSYRSWELKSVPSRDIFNSECLPIDVQYKQSSIIRVQNLSSSSWLSDLSRFATEGLQYNRLTSILGDINFYKVLHHQLSNLAVDYKFGSFISFDGLKSIISNKISSPQQLYFKGIKNVFLININLETIAPNKFIELASLVRSRHIKLHFVGPLSNALYLTKLALPFTLHSVDVNQISALINATEKSLAIQSIDFNIPSAISVGNGPGAIAAIATNLTPLFDNNFNYSEGSLPDYIVLFDFTNFDEIPAELYYRVIYFGTHIAPYPFKLQVPIKALYETVQTYMDDQYKTFQTPQILSNNSNLLTIEQAIKLYFYNKSLNKVSKNELRHYPKVKSIYDCNMYAINSPTLQLYKRNLNK